jgi:hypothetical protein
MTTELISLKMEELRMPCAFVNTNVVVNVHVHLRNKVFKTKLNGCGSGLLLGEKISKIRLNQFISIQYIATLKERLGTSSM